ncbi:Subtilisin-like protease SDD1 [Apostasia shenzhenica]|uniref:Subtilisin-like protease SDD1 n=1 Tax=Apostasia shenzhenica TaxID=1088818 RepID=A0A2H9ZRR6_9ASPA|nr:Subtilisin-like protease SDD1 [Apostasia shenzhenica]
MLSPLLTIILLLCTSSSAPPLAHGRNIPAAGAGGPAAGDDQHLKTYIVHFDHHDPEIQEDSLIINRLLNNMSTSTQPRILYSYNKVINGFAVRLTQAQLSLIRAKPGFLHAFPDAFLPLATTHTPQFLGLEAYAAGGFWNQSGFGRGIIVAVLDTGILPDHPSFNADGIPPPPSRWKGRCEFANYVSNSVCNNKLIGARSFVQGAKALIASKGLDLSSAASPPLDTIGHGTHTASTAVGRIIGKVSALNNAAGTAAGMAPEAHLAIYKICTESGCAASDILAALDAAVEDGADVLSLSLGAVSPLSFDNDVVAIGTLAAVEKGIFVSLAAGNNGPSESQLSNDAPWMLTVGASTMDRVIRTSVKLGNGEEYEGESMQFQSDSNIVASESPPLVYLPAANFCSSFNNSDVKGKIVVCDRGAGFIGIQQGAAVKAAGGAGMILAGAETDGYTTLAEAHVLPASQVSFADAMKIKAYINSTSSPTAAIIPRGTLIGEGFPAPMVASFSSRGPSLRSKGILKPDIIGPGVNVLAGWPSLPIGPSGTPSLFNVFSGTSMSTPHLSGIAALLKSAHPSWTPAMIRSAIITTAGDTNTAGKPIADEQLKDADFFSKGAGQVNPNKANNPGFVYDIQPDDYIAYMCGLNYTDKQVTTVARRTVNCSSIQSILGAELNYPSFSVEMRASFTRKVSRTATNVGQSSATYSVEVVAPAGIEVVVSPTELTFSEADQKLSYTVEFISSGGSKSANKYEEGCLRWVSSDKVIRVTSPISITMIDL